MKSSTDSQISRRIFAIAIPVSLQMLVQYALTLTDTAFIGYYKPDGLSALFNAVTPYFMFNSFFFALTQGLTIFIARSLGAGKVLLAGRYAESGLFFNQFLSFLYFLLWFFFSDFVLGLLGADTEVRRMGVSYLKIMSFNFFFMGFSLTAASVFKGTGETLPILLGSLLKTVFNIVLDWFLIFGHCGFPKLGIRGAAIATVVSEGAGTLLLLFFLARQKKVPIFQERVLFPAFELYKGAFLLGLPSGLDFMLWSTGQTVLIAILNRIGKMATAYYGVFNTIMNLSVYLYFGIGVAGMNLVAIAVGAQDYKRIGKVSFLTVFYGVLICIVVALLFLFFPARIFGVFMSGELHLSEIRGYFFLLALIIFPKMINVIVGSLIKGTGDTGWLLITQIPGTILIVLFAHLTVIEWHYGLLGLLIVLFVDEFWRAVANALKLRFSFAELKNKP